MNSLTQSFHL
jgi:pseudouridine-5'-phosphate glycosidase